jgi:hypothetical protein
MYIHTHSRKKKNIQRLQKPVEEQEQPTQQEQMPHLLPELHKDLQHSDKISPKTVLMLQRMYGNRATARLLNEGKQRTALQRQKAMRAGQDGSYVVQRETIDKAQSDDQYGWNYKYAVRFTENRCILKIKVKLTAAAHPDTGDLATDKEITTLQEQAASAFASYWDNVFLLVDGDTKKKYSLRTELEFVKNGEDLAATVYKGTGRSDLSNWYSADDSTTFAHELGHQLGLKDEYIDDTTVNRKDKDAPGVHQDNSLMGNYYDEGISKAEVKLRHGEHLAKDISAATGRKFSALKPSGIEMFFRKIFS